MSKKLDDQLRLIALAHLKNGKKPKEVAELLDINYATAVKLRKDLAEAEKRDTVDELFKLESYALEALLEAAKQEVSPLLDILGNSDSLEGELIDIREAAKDGDSLDVELSTAATVLANRINMIAVTSSSPETMLMLAKALAELQGTFYAPGTGSSSAAIGLEELLRD